MAQGCLLSSPHIRFNLQRHLWEIFIKENFMGIWYLQYLICCLWLFCLAFICIGEVSMLRRLIIKLKISICWIHRIIRCLWLGSIPPQQIFKKIYKNTSRILSPRNTSFKNSTPWDINSCHLLMKNQKWKFMRLKSCTTLMDIFLNSLSMTNL